jgi:hypothetical protein
VRAAHYSGGGSVSSGPKPRLSQYWFHGVMHPSVSAVHRGRLAAVSLESCLQSIRHAAGLVGCSGGWCICTCAWHSSV